MDKILEEKHDHAPLEFPNGFLWGAATSAHQVEGNNDQSDWWFWELKNQPPQKRSGRAADHYKRYKEDFSLAKELGHNSHRLSIEWSRIEPHEGVFDQTQIDHYINVLSNLKEQGFTVMLTLHHFSNPEWIAQIGGWENGKTVDFFNRFVDRILPEIKQYVDMWITINEPGVYVYMGYETAMWPPQKKSKVAAGKVFWNLAQAHKKAYETIHKHVQNAQVGIAHNAASFSHLHHHSLLEAVTVWTYDFGANHAFFYLTGLDTHDFIGINYYFNKYISFDGEHSMPGALDITDTKKEITDMGWEIHPEGIFSVLMDFSDYHKPIYITENGLASTNDDRRARFLISYLKEIYHAIQFGVDVKGYFHWSLLDNFEWADGFTPRFGLIEVDYYTQNRVPRPSAYLYSEIIASNKIPHHFLKFVGHTVDVIDVLDHKIRCESCMSRNHHND
jgi:beta-glucosidase